MRSTVLRLGFVFFLPALALSFAQTADRFESGPFKGFTRSPTEHIIDPLGTPLKVQSVRGVIKYPSGEPMPEVIIEIRDRRGVVSGVQTNQRGEFRIPGVPAGKYDFKFTKGGFQSIVGTIEVSKAAPKENRIALEMQLGV